LKNINQLSAKAPDSVNKADTKKQFRKLQEQLPVLQNLFYAEGKHALLIILQGMDTSGKDSTIRHVFSAINPQGCKVKSFKKPTEEELSHDFLWRIYSQLPEKRMIQLFNRSHYEDIIVPSVNKVIDKKEIQRRIHVINMFEEHLQNSGTLILKFFLNISEEKQQQNLKERLTDPEKKWKYDSNDKKESAKWDTYMNVYQTVLNGCTKTNPWIIVPADQKWYRNYLVASTVIKTLEELKMKFPQKLN